MAQTGQIGTGWGSGAAFAESGGDLRPLFRVAIFGLAGKLQRVTEIVLRHARHNQYRFVVAPGRGPGEYDIAVVDMTARGGPEVASTLRRLPRARPVVRLGRRSDEVRGQDDLLQSSFTVNLLKTLNRVVESSLLAEHEAAALPVLAPALFGRRAPSDRHCALIVDDSPSVRRQLTVALQRMGLECEGAQSAHAALDLLAQRAYAIAFVDVVMPEMDGYRLTREIKRNRATRPMPVVILTSRSSPFDLARGALAGCDSYLVKPVALHSLRATVSRQLARTG
ncbi:MAG: response regulator [Burkholderiaceae bacterium]|nr:response regulator [Burkholderiaceae bacterium]